MPKIRSRLGRMRGGGRHRAPDNQGAKSARNRAPPPRGPHATEDPPTYGNHAGPSGGSSAPAIGPPPHVRASPPSTACRPSPACDPGREWVTQRAIYGAERRGKCRCPENPTVTSRTSSLAHAHLTPNSTRSREFDGDVLRVDARLEVAAKKTDTKKTSANGLRVTSMDRG